MPRLSPSPPAEAKLGVQIPTELYTELRILALRRHVTMKSLIQDMISRELSRPLPQSRPASDKARS